MKWKYGKFYQNCIDPNKFIKFAKALINFYKVITRFRYAYRSIPNTRYF